MPRSLRLPPSRPLTDCGVARRPRCRSAAERRHTLRRRRPRQAPASPSCMPRCDGTFPPWARSSRPSRPARSAASRAPLPSLPRRSAPWALRRCVARSFGSCTPSSTRVSRCARARPSSLSCSLLRSARVRRAPRRAHRLGGARRGKRRTAAAGAARGEAAAAAGLADWPAPAASAATAARPRAPSPSSAAALATAATRRLATHLASQRAALALGLGGAGRGGTATLVRSQTRAASLQ